MSGAIRPIFQHGERLTAHRLNEAVDYLRTYLRRILLAPLSPGVAVGLELSTHGAGAVAVNPGVAVDGAGRFLVLSAPLSFGLSEVKAQIPDLADQSVVVSLAIDDGAPNLDPCAPQLPLRVVEDVKLVFRKLVAPRLSDLQDTPSVGVAPWGDLGDGGRTPEDLSVPLGEVKADLSPSMDARTGIMPRMDGIRNTLGDVSILLGQVDGKPEVLFDVPAGGPDVQASAVAVNLRSPPAGRASPMAPFVFEAAGGRGSRAGISGALAVSMEYDAAAGKSAGFPAILHSGFPLALSPTSTTDPKVVPYLESIPALPLLGISAGTSHTDPDGRTLVPVVTSGLVLAWVDMQGKDLFVGAELTPIPFPMGNQLHLTLAEPGQPVVARSAVMLQKPTGPFQALVWAAPPYPAAQGDLAQTIKDLKTEVDKLQASVDELKNATPPEAQKPKVLGPFSWGNGGQGSGHFDVPGIWENAPTGATRLVIESATLTVQRPGNVPIKETIDLRVDNASVETYTVDIPIASDNNAVNEAIGTIIFGPGLGTFFGSLFGNNNAPPWSEVRAVDVEVPKSKPLAIWTHDSGPGSWWMAIVITGHYYAP